MWNICQCATPHEYMSSHTRPKNVLEMSLLSFYTMTQNIETDEITKAKMKKIQEINLEIEREDKRNEVLSIQYKMMLVSNRKNVQKSKAP